ncbi:MAG: S8 family serine peptidase, partial [Nocardioides sp.]|nr:S8 family serine peptidase [Nocardioides sp.]
MTRKGVALAAVAATGAALALASVAVPGSAQGAPPAVAASPAASSGVRSTVLLDRGDRVARRALVAADATRLVEYGAFSLWSVPARGRAAVAEVPALAATLSRPQILLRGRTLETSRPVPAPTALPTPDTDGPRLEIVQYVGPVKPSWVSDLEGTGARVVSYLPDNAYVVLVGPAATKAFDELVGSDPLVQYSGAFHPEYRLAPELLDLVEKPATAPRTSDVTVQVVDGPGADEAVAAVTAGRELIAPPYRMLGVRTLSVRVDSDDLSELASMPSVFDVESYVEPQLTDEIQDQLLAGNVTTSGGKTLPSGPGYLSWLGGHNFPTNPLEYPVVTVVDDGIDNGTVDPLHPDFYVLGNPAPSDRLIANDDCTTDPSANGVGGHGNLNAGIVGGYNNGTGTTNEDADGYQYGLGVSPYGRVSGLKIFRNTGSFDISGCGGTILGLVAAAFAGGADITTNSWGASVGGAYDAQSQAFDALTRDASVTTAGLQEMLHIASAGNDGPGASTIGSPGTGKNVLTVGATENIREDGVLDGCNLDTADNDSDIAGFSSRGPAADGRAKPELVAAGTHVQGPASQDPAYDGTGVCGSVGDRYHPLGNTLYTWSSGTSHSTPAIAGAASLVHEFYGRVWDAGATPSPAMLRALLANAPRYLQGGVGTGDTLPSPNQGLGVPDLGVLFDAPASRMLLDQETLFTGTGQTARRVGTVTDTSKGVRVTLAYTDAPGATVGASWVNDLDLRVTVGGETYLGNVFSGDTSAAGGAADEKNNLESIWLPAGTSGPISVQVIAKNIAGDGVPGNATLLDQDFALTVSNMTEGASAVVKGDGLSFTDSADGNTTPDPGEPLAVTASVANAGNVSTGPASGTLEVVSGPVEVTRAASAFASVAPDGTGTNLTGYRVQ